MADPLVGQSDVETALLRPLTPVEAQFIGGLCDQASAKMRTAMRAVDSRIARYTVDPDDPAGLDPFAVASVLAGVIKAYLVNPRGLWSQTHSEGPLSESETFLGSRGGASGLASSLGVLEVTAADLAQLAPVTIPVGGTIRAKAVEPITLNELTDPAYYGRYREYDRWA